MMGGGGGEHLCRSHRIKVDRYLPLLLLEDLVPLLYLLSVLGPPVLEPDLHLQLQIN